MEWPTLSALRGAAGRLNGDEDSTDGVEQIILTMTGWLDCITMGFVRPTALSLPQFSMMTMRGR